MRRFVAALAASGAVLGTTAHAVQASSRATPQHALQRALAQQMRAGGGRSSALVVDLSAGRRLFARAAGVRRLPASVEKLYTTTTALLRFGPAAHLATSVLGVGAFDSAGVWHGTLFLKGGGDPTFGSQSFDHAAYGTGATMERLVAGLIRRTGITAVDGPIVGDESYFDSLRGTAPYGYRAAGDIEGELSALAFDRGLAAGRFQARPALYAAQQFAAALRAAGVSLLRPGAVRSGHAPPTAQLLALVQSPPMATLLKLTNTPSDNFFAEMLLKDLGARFAGAGTTAAGAAVVRSQLASRFNIHPTLVDGSGLSRADSTTPLQVVTLLSQMIGNQTFAGSLAIAGETGTLQHEMNGTVAQGNCRGKTGTLHDAANLAGFCTAADGHTLVFAFLANGLGNPDLGHKIEANMAVAIAKYKG
jgi:D-alanyl-D-alanine carboxypeptidase/D-alanyl-D-alanine-endopeptidase (penicillin-binding protein 4)